MAQTGKGYGSTRTYRDDPGFREYHDDPSAYQQTAGRYSEMVDQIRSNVFSINNGANAIERAMKNIGTDRDSPQLKDKIHETSQNTIKIVQQTTRLLKNAGVQRADKQQRMQLDRLKSDFQESVQRFQSLQKKAADRVKSATKLSTPTSTQPMSQTTGWTEDNYTDRSPFVEREQRQQDLQAQQQIIEDDLALIREREERIRQLEADVLDVNEIFRDLGAMIHEQGEVLDTIESNVERAAGNVESGNEQLVKAAEYQRKSRKKMCCLLVTFLIIAVIVTIILVVTLKK